MNEPPPQKFMDMIKGFLPLWRSIRVSGMAANIEGRWCNIGMRVELLGAVPARSEIVFPDPNFLYYVKEFDFDCLANVLNQLTLNGSFTLESKVVADSVEIFLRPKLSNALTPLSPINWYGPNRREPNQENSHPGPRCTSIAIGIFGENVNSILNADLQRRVESKLRLDEPGHDGLSGLTESLIPGAAYQNWQQTLVEAVAELPFTIESVGHDKLLVRSSGRVAGATITARFFYRPKAPNASPRVNFRPADAKATDSGWLEWQYALDWPMGVDRVKVTLFYDQEEVQSLELVRTELRRKEMSSILKSQLSRSSPVALPPTIKKERVSVKSTNKILSFKTALETYRPIEVVGEGGAGRVYKVQTEGGNVFAVKCLDAKKATTTTRKRFKIELQFCTKNEHENIVTVSDHGTVSIDDQDCPFYVMPYYPQTLRDLIKKGISQQEILPLFVQILHGVEAAHLKNIWHRDLKPANILHDPSRKLLVVADFGIAHFEEVDLVTMVQTDIRDRLANFQYAAPEQRLIGGSVDHRADIHALGLILNEMFTGHVPQVTGYRKIQDVAPDFAYLDEIVDKMMQQFPENRPSSIDEVKARLAMSKNLFISRQKLDNLRKTVVPSASIASRFAMNPVSVTEFDVRGNSLVAILNDNPQSDWLRFFSQQRPGQFLAGAEPINWRFRNKEARLEVHPSRLESESLLMFEHFKNYLLVANAGYAKYLEALARQREQEEAEDLKVRIGEEERRQRILSKIKNSVSM